VQPGRVHFFMSNDIEWLLTTRIMQPVMTACSKKPQSFSGVWADVAHMHYLLAKEVEQGLRLELDKERDMGHEATSIRN